MRRKRIVVVDDHKVFAELMSLAVRGEPEFHVVGHAQSVTAGMAMVEQEHPDVVLMDVRLGDGDGIAATATLTERHPELLVVVLTAHADADIMRRAAEANACALLAKDGDLAGLLEVLRHAELGGFAVDPQLMARLSRPVVVPQQRAAVLDAA